MITFSKISHFKDPEMKKEMERWFKYTQNPTRCWMYSFVKLNIDFKDKDVLDVGGGRSPFADYLQEPLKSFDVLDIDSKSLGVKNHNQFLVMDITKEAPEKEYDLVLCLSTLEHIKEWRQAIKNMDSCLKIGGNLVLVIDIFSSKRQFHKSQIPELLTQLKNYDLGKIDLSIDGLWTIKSAANLFPSMFKSRASSWDVAELLIFGIKKGKLNVEEIPSHYQEEGLAVW